ncbi:hypothetical protein M9H77_11956 [Catharanthus roseus]|uniref:Uncharacterized protein n=1 Tax=Catharanthus roseus TaxID=4058 RepID=A0ACC0BG78_CATRO|nr:hypothetical protein M9H77_11956 [Catharanthus roseus]
MSVVGLEFQLPRHSRHLPSMVGCPAIRSCPLDFDVTPQVQPTWCREDYNCHMLRFIGFVLNSFQNTEGARISIACRRVRLVDTSRGRSVNSSTSIPNGGEH